MILASGRCTTKSSTHMHCSQMEGEWLSISHGKGLEFRGRWKRTYQFQLEVKEGKTILGGKRCIGDFVSGVI